MTPQTVIIRWDDESNPNDPGWVFVTESGIVRAISGEVGRVREYTEAVLEQAELELDWPDGANVQVWNF